MIGLLSIATDLWRFARCGSHTRYRAELPGRVSPNGGTEKRTVDSNQWQECFKAGPISILISGKSASKQALSQIADRLIGPEYNREHSRRYVYVDTEGILAVGSYSKTDPQVASRHTRHIGEGGPPHVYVALSATPEA